MLSSILEGLELGCGLHAKKLRHTIKVLMINIEDFFIVYVLKLSQQMSRYYFFS